MYRRSSETDAPCLRLKGNWFEPMVGVEPAGGGRQCGWWSTGGKDQPRWLESGVELTGAEPGFRLSTVKGVSYQSSGLSFCA